MCSPVIAAVEYQIKSHKKPNQLKKLSLVLNYCVCYYRLDIIIYYFKGIYFKEDKNNAAYNPRVNYIIYGVNSIDKYKCRVYDN